MTLDPLPYFLQNKNLFQVTTVPRSSTRVPQTASRCEQWTLAFHKKQTVAL